MTTPAKSELDEARERLEARARDGRLSTHCHAAVADLRLVLDALKEAERANVDLYVALRNAAPALLATVEAQRKEISELRDEVQRWVDRGAHYRNLAVEAGVKRESLDNEDDARLVDLWEANQAERDALNADVERLRADRSQFAERVAVAAMQDFIGRMRPNEPYGAADMSRGRCCIDAALRGEEAPRE